MYICIYSSTTPSALSLLWAIKVEGLSPCRCCCLCCCSTATCHAGSLRTSGRNTAEPERPSRRPVARSHRLCTERAAPGHSRHHQCSGRRPPRSCPCYRCCCCTTGLSAASHWASARILLFNTNNRKRHLPPSGPAGLDNNRAHHRNHCNARTCGSRTCPNNIQTHRWESSRVSISFRTWLRCSLSGTDMYRGSLSDTCLYSPHTSHGLHIHPYPYIRT